MNIETNIVQMIPYKEGKLIAIRGIIPDEDDNHRGIIFINGDPIKCMRKERYVIEDGVVRTENFFFHVSFLSSFLISSGSVNEENVALLNKVLPKNIL